MLSTDAIVAGSPSALLHNVRLRLAVAVTALLLMAALGLLRGLSEPSTGWLFDVDAQHRVIAVDLHSAGRMNEVSAIRGVNCDGTTAQIPVTADLMRETGGIAQYYSEHTAFYAAHAQLWTLLSCSARANHPVSVTHAAGETVLPLSSKAPSELGWRFWFPWTFGLLAFSVGLAVWVYRPVDRGASWYLVSSACYAFWVMIVAAMGSRLLTHPSFGLQNLHLMCHAAGHLYLIGLCMLLWRFPTSLDRPAFTEKRLMWGMLAWAAGFLVVDIMQWVPTINLGFRWPNLALVLVLVLLFAGQWHSTQEDPLRRAPLKWLGFLLLVTLSLAFVTTLFAIANQWTFGRMAYGFAPMSLIFIGFVPLVTKLKMFKLELWWTRAWLWFLGGVLVVLLDLLLVHWLAFDSASALGIALALAGWLYFPVRQWLWQRFSQSALPQASEVLPDIIALSSARARASHSQIWQDLWEKQWHPQSLRLLALADHLSIHAQGQLLHVPALGNLPALQLGMPLRGARLYNLADLQRAKEIHALVKRGLEASDALQQGARQERQRIAADLHDDLGAKLLTIAQTAQNPQHGGRVAELARQALEDMRLAVRGFSASAIPAMDLQADWRAELLERLDAAGIEAQWQDNAPPEGLLLSATAQVQLTRVLRETVSNVIRHSQARHCALGVEWSEQGLRLRIEDDGIGLPASQTVSGQRHGLGLNNIERRVHKLAGVVQWQAIEPTGVRMQADIPLLHLLADTRD